MPIKAKPRKAALSDVEAVRHLAALTAAVTRAGFASRLGQSYGGERDIYEALGYKKNLIYNDYLLKYDRQDIAKAIIDRPAAACWRRPPEIIESQDADTPFEREWSEMAERLQIWSYFRRLDRLAALGQYAVLLIGFGDGLELRDPAQNGKTVNYVMPYGEGAAKIKAFDEDPTSERFGKPQTYEVEISTNEKKQSLNVHWSRIVHVAEDALDNDVYGTPRLKAVFNRLQDLDLVAGGSAEMFWRGAFPGMSFDLAPDANPDAQELTQLKDEIEEYIHGLKRSLRTQGVDVKQLALQVADPASHVDVLVTLIAAATRTPKRILLGSERGELSSGQDEDNWIDQVDDRRTNFCEPMIIRQFIARCISAKALSEPKDRISVEWPDLKSKSEKDVAEIGEIRSRTLKNYTETIGGDLLIPPENMMEEFLGMSKDAIERIKGERGEIILDADGTGDEPGGDGE